MQLAHLKDMKLTHDFQFFAVWHGKNLCCWLILGIYRLLDASLEKQLKFALTTFAAKPLRTSFTGCSPSANLPKESVGGALAAYK